MCCVRGVAGRRGGGAAHTFCRPSMTRAAPYPSCPVTQCLCGAFPRSGVLSGEELVVLADWVWASIQPRGQTIPPHERRQLGEALLRCADTHAHGAMTFSQFAQWFQRACVAQWWPPLRTVSERDSTGQMSGQAGEGGPGWPRAVGGSGIGTVGPQDTSGLSARHQWLAESLAEPLATQEPPVQPGSVVHSHANAEGLDCLPDLRSAAARRNLFTDCDRVGGFGEDGSASDGTTRPESGMHPSTASTAASHGALEYVGAVGVNAGRSNISPGSLLRRVGVVCACARAVGVRNGRASLCRAGAASQFCGPSLPGVPAARRQARRQPRWTCK